MGRDCRLAPDSQRMNSPLSKVRGQRPYWRDQAKDFPDGLGRILPYGASSPAEDGTKPGSTTPVPGEALNSGPDFYPHASSSEYIPGSDCCRARKGSGCRANDGMARAYKRA